MDSDSDSLARQRFLAFKMGGGPPPNTLHTFSRHSHRRSRSRNSSISSFPLSPSAPSLSPDSPPSNAHVKRPASHHHRRSSVSTRRESAELMGVSLPELPTSHSDDLSDKDSIRRRALWALEGKPDLSFSKVEIPDITSPDLTKPFDFPTKPSFPPGAALNGMNTFSGKRDSFGKMFGSTSASKDQLGTLVEEEEEEDDAVEHTDPHKQVTEPPAKTLTRHRPASLNLRPLSLVQGSIVGAVSASLPTPTCTPGTRSNARGSCTTASLDASVSPTVIIPPISSARRFSYTCSDVIPVSVNTDKKRCSSISYKRSTDFIPRDAFVLPTPEMTPTEHRFSFASDQETLIEQPLSAADQHFLYRSHHVLLSRITELERTLSNRASHVSYPSDGSLTSEPNDEMLQLISNLKVERDELKRDVDGWRQRLADADKQAEILAKRIEAERREAWVARSRLGLLEVEKSGLEKSLEVKAAALAQTMAENAVLIRERDGMKDEILKLNARLKDVDAAVDECARLRATLEQERVRRRELEKVLDDAGLLNTPKLPHTASGTRKRSPLPVKPINIRGLGFQSVDSESSTTDVESADDSFTKTEFALDAVAEEDVEIYDEDNGLTGYEDEEESDLSFSSPESSSIGSADELDIVPKPPMEDIPSLPTHTRRASLSKTWTFPRGKPSAPNTQVDEVDRFFGCLDDADRSPPCSQETESTFSSLFRFTSDDDELPPFILPPDVGVVVESTSSGNLDVVPEEDEDDEGSDGELVGEEVEGGIRFTFNAPPTICVTPPPDICITPPPEIRITPPIENSMANPTVRPHMDDPASIKPVPLPASIEDDEDESTLNFVFPFKDHLERTISPPGPSPPPSSGLRPSSRIDSPPSSIPRAVSLRSMSPKTPSITFTPSKSMNGRFTSAYPSPPSKKMWSSIPQPVSPPKHCSAPTKMSAIASKTNDVMPASRCSDLTQSGGATPEVNGPNNLNPSSLSSSTCEYFRDISSLSTTSSPPAARSPFQKLTNFISFTWTPGAAAVASYIVPGSSLNPEAMDTSGAIGPAQRRFVPKARQLEKLRSRLTLEMKNGITPCCMVSACKGCAAEHVYL